MLTDRLGRGRRRSRLGESQYCSERTVVRYGARREDAGPVHGNDIIVGRFVDKTRPTFLEAYEEQIVKKHHLVK